MNLIDVRQQWGALCDRVDGEKRLLGVALEQGAPTDLSGSELEITFDTADSFNFESALKGREVIKSAFLRQFGVSRRIIIKQDTISKGMRPAKRKTEHQRKRERFAEELEQRPVWNEMVKRFGLKLAED